LPSAFCGEHTMDEITSRRVRHDRSWRCRVSFICDVRTVQV
jgi:hypothetical protein